jgi:hypothetical protein
MDSEIVEDFLDFKCPYCGTLNSFPASAANLVRECMNCLEPFLVPETDGGTALKFPLPYWKRSISRTHLAVKKLHNVFITFAAARMVLSISALV